MPQAYGINIVKGREKTYSNTNKRKIHLNNLFNMGFMEVIFSPQRCHQRSLLANHLAITDTHEHIIEYNNKISNPNKR